jgi:DNA-binding winged helix-turn-helix (wHTH) protein/tetratricopeptide (TPR) repeat protein
MPHTNHLTYEFGPYKLSVAQRVLTRDGEIISLTPKATEILVRLVVNAGQLLEKDDLLKEVWPDTFVEEANLTQNIFTLRRALGDERAGPRYIETVSRRGYRFVAEVRVCDSDGQGAAAAAAGELAESQPGADADDIVSPRPVVAVLPFLNETGDDGLEYLAEGVTDNIINNLSRVSRMRVMSRSAVFRRNARAVDPQTFGRELGATAVLVGKITSRPAIVGSVEPVRPALLSGAEDGLGTKGMLSAGVEPGGTGLKSADATGTEASGRGVEPMQGHRVEPAAEGVELGNAGGLESVAEGVDPVPAGGAERVPDDVKPRRAAVPEGMKRPHAGGVKTVLGIGVELVDVATGWQIWGESFDCESNDLLQIQDSITRQLLVNLKLKLTGEEEKRVTARYTENARAYQAYLEGRYHWSRYTRKGIETAIKNFRRAIELDSNYALAYAAIVDCYLRLATNYLPPEAEVQWSASDPFLKLSVLMADQPEQRIMLRFKWDWKGVERELRRANELKTHYPSIYQWHVAYQMSKQLYGESLRKKRSRSYHHLKVNSKLDSKLAPQMPYIKLTPAEEVQILCSIARDQMAIGNYEAAGLILRDWAVMGKWPQLEYLNGYAAADLLFTSGTLFGFIAGSKPVPHGHKHAQALLNGSVALFEHLGIKSRAVEARVELTRCYYRQGLLEIARQTGLTALSELPHEELELKTLALIALGVVERDLGFLNESLLRLREAASVEVAGCLVTGRCHIDLATTLKDLALSQDKEAYLMEAKNLFLRALYESEALGHHRNVASVENNIGFLLLNIKSYRESEPHLLRARRVFEGLGDTIRKAQVNETLARLYIEIAQYDQAAEVINSAVTALELTDSEALLVEALTTKGIVASRKGDYRDAKKSFEAAQKVAERCGDPQGVCRALVGMFEELKNYLDVNEEIKIARELKRLLPAVTHSPLAARIQGHLVRIIPLDRS